MAATVKSISYYYDELLSNPGLFLRKYKVRYLVQNTTDRADLLLIYFGFINGSFDTNANNEIVPSDWFGFCFTNNVNDLEPTPPGKSNFDYRTRTACIWLPMRKGDPRYGGTDLPGDGVIDGACLLSDFPEAHLLITPGLSGCSIAIGKDTITGTILMRHIQPTTTQVSTDLSKKLSTGMRLKHTTSGGHASIYADITHVFGRDKGYSLCGSVIGIKSGGQWQIFGCNLNNTGSEAQNVEQIIMG